MAGVTGGNVGAATGSAIAGDIVTASTVNTIKDWAIAQSNGNPDTARLLTNAIENVIAGAIGAGAGGAINGGSGALNGLGISSDLQQYNQSASEREEEFRPEDRDENGRLIDPLQEAIWKVSYNNSERELRGLCKDCSALTSINPTITEEMVNTSREELEAAQKLEQSGRPVNSSNIQKVKNGQIDDIDPVADPARGNPSDYDDLPDLPTRPVETTRPKPTQPTETEWNNFDNPKAPTDPSQNTVEIPQKAKDTLNRVDEKGSPFAGYKGGRTYNNNPKPGEQKLPEQDANGNTISYKEWDTDLYVKGNRNADRVVTGSDGSAYYTNTHYRTFQKIR
ncbi:ribonuclease domain-containing protein [Commensalibacter nepenthis]|uniref:Ribonuclease domain-containing protein n=1 Tax=Commensalibacter nepenthis TaxID=3043872 RepID=A0ABT6Q5M8_9PROT|nr:ribonuclease domain-containing protein [Commensalibacter sp. TBRC 10068]MDI2112205.1 ribonuclease domain-containing protein [Commensalibacter sp. TBRC 10068]